MFAVAPVRTAPSTASAPVPSFPRVLTGCYWIAARSVLAHTHYCMSHTQTLNMAQIRGTAGYNLGGAPNRFGAGPNYSNMKADATSDPSPLDAIREQTSKIEDWLDTYSEPIKPCEAPSASLCAERAR